MQESPPPTDNYLTLADVVGVYGVKGWVKLRSQLEDTDLLTRLPELHLHPPATSASASMLAQAEPVQGTRGGGGERGGGGPGISISPQREKANGLRIADAEFLSVL